VAVVALAAHFLATTASVILKARCPSHSLLAIKPLHGIAFAFGQAEKKPLRGPTNGSQETQHAFRGPQGHLPPHDRLDDLVQVEPAPGGYEGYELWQPVHSAQYVLPYLCCRQRPAWQQGRGARKRNFGFGRGWA
jgi:hypothetical protein